MAKIKDKDRLLKAARERNKVTYKGKPIRQSSDFSAETLQDRREWHDILNEMKQSLEEFISRMDNMQEAIDGIKTREQERIEADAERDKRNSRNKTILRELCDQYKRNNIHIIRVPEEEEREKGQKVYLKK